MSEYFWEEEIFINNIEVLESQLRNMFAGVVWTHKIQEKQADIYLNRLKILEFFRIGSSAITASGIFAVMFIDKFSLKIATAIISLLSLFINSYYKTYDLKGLQKQHKKSALALLEIREEFITVLCDIKLNKYTEDDLIKKRDDLLKRQMNIYKGALDASTDAYNKTQKALKIQKDNTYSDEEIDSFLPIVARKDLTI